MKDGDFRATKYFVDHYNEITKLDSSLTINEDEFEAIKKAFDKCRSHLYR